MPIEMWKVAFSQDELKISFLNYCRAEGLDIPDSNISNIDIVEGDVTSAILNFSPTDAIAKQQITLKHEQIEQALLQSCYDLSIPLPKQKPENIQCHKNMLSMVFAIPRNIIWG